MKKFLTAFLLTALVSLGVVAVSEPPASAACPYSACINTTTTVKAPAKVKGQHAVPIRVSVAAPGNITPTGTIHVVVTKSNGRVKYDSTQAYAGGTLTFVTQGLRHGYYHVTATYTPTTGSVWNGSSASTLVHVKKVHRIHHH